MPGVAGRQGDAQLEGAMNALAMARIRWTRGFAIVAVALCLSGFGADDLVAAGSDDPDWPCIQRKVPEISPGMVWAGPPVEELEQAWSEDPQVAQLADRIAARRTPIEEAETAIADFAARLEVEKDRKLTLLFAATLAAINSERNSLIIGIRRYARRQAELAERIQERITELNQLPSGEAQDDRRRELEEAQLWDTRIYEERERSLTYICEQPVLLEQRIFALARVIMAQLD